MQNTPRHDTLLQVLMAVSPRQTPNPPKNQEQKSRSQGKEGTEQGKRSGSSVDAEGFVPARLLHSQRMRAQPQHNFLSDTRCKFGAAFSGQPKDTHHGSCSRLKSAGALPATRIATGSRDGLLVQTLGAALAHEPSRKPLGVFVGALFLPGPMSAEASMR